MLASMAGVLPPWYLVLALLFFKSLAVCAAGGSGVPRQ
jgi:hypothetical protein